MKVITPNLWLLRSEHENNDAPDDGMHPTADPIVFMFLQWLGAAGEVGRHAASRGRTDR